MVSDNSPPAHAGGGGAPFRLSVLDQSPIADGSTGAQALRNSVDLARLAESLGYHRYWVAEHHGTPALACASPEVLIAAIGEATSRIRVGSGGVMLPHYSPMKVAASFSMLAGLLPGRVDLGLGRAFGTDSKAALALQRDRRRAMPDDFREHLEELLAYLGDGLPDGHPFARLAKTLPGRPERPEPWLLGSSAQSAVWAAELGLPYAFADFINPGGASYAARYRDAFAPSPWQDEPRVAVAAWAICADTDAEARRLAAPFEMMMTLMHRGQLIPVPSPETAAAFLAAEQTGGRGLPLRQARRIIAGAPQTVRQQLEAVAAEYGAAEVLIVNIMYRHEDRRRSYELIADAFGLTATADAGADALPAGA